MQHILSVLLLILISVSSSTGQSKEIGFPFINNFTPKQYNANTQNWAAVEDKRGVMYFGNNKGVLEYDGLSWTIIPVNNNSIVRSLAVDSSGIIYVGAVGEFGYLAPDKTGKLLYHSLVPKNEKAASLFSDVWSILIKGKEIYFQSSTLLFRYKNGEIEKWPLQNAYHRSFLIHNTIYLRDEGKGLMVMKNDSLRPVKGGNLFANEPISAMLPFQDKILIGSRIQGLFLFDPKKETISPFMSKANSFLTKSKIYHGITLPNGSYAFSTIKDGVAIINADSSIFYLNQRAGLQSKSIFHLYLDREGSLWLSTANGISKVEIGFPISFFNKVHGLDGGVSAVTRYKGILYVATHQGVFFLDKENHFQKVRGFQYQCWQLDKFNVPDNPSQQKLLATNANGNGVYEIVGDTAIMIMKGRASAVKTSHSNPARVFVGFNGYISSIYYKNGQWITEGSLQIGSAEFRSIQEDNEGNIWLGSMFDGIYKLKVKDWEAYLAGHNEQIHDSIKNYKVAEGLPTNNWNYVYHIHKTLAVATQHGVYRYNKQTDLFEKDKKINKALNNQERWFYYLSEDKKGNLWFDSDKGMGMLQKRENDYLLFDKAFKRIYVSSENQVGGYAEEDGIMWVGTSEGLFRYDSHTPKEYKKSFTVLIRKAVIGTDSVIFHGNSYQNFKNFSDKHLYASLATVNSEIPVLDYKHNSLSFHYSAPIFHNEISTRFSYLLEGYDKHWSAWTEETKKEYTNLREGEYAFKVKALDLYGNISEEAVYQFVVSPPWYRTPFAYMASFLLLVGIAVFATKAYTNRLMKDNHRLESIVQSRTAEMNEQREKIEKQKDEVVRSYQSVSTLSQIGQSITATLDIQSIIYTLYKSIGALMDVSAFAVGVYNKKSKSLDFYHAFLNNKELKPFSYCLNANDKMGVWCFNHEKEVFLNNLHQEYSIYIPSLAALPVEGMEHPQSVIYLPLMIQKRILGVITVQSFQKHAYLAHHLDILRTLAAYTAIALDNAHAYLQLNKVNEELFSTLKDLKNTQAKLIQSEKMASLGQLTAGVAHEINNPINFVSAGIDSLNSSYEELNVLLQKYSALRANADNTEILQQIEKLKKEFDLEFTLKEIPQLLKSIKVGAARTTEIVKSLKNFSRLDEDVLKLADIHEGLESTLIILHNQLTDRIEVSKEYAKLPLVSCYPGQLNQVFMNILTNAIQAIEGKGKIYVHTALQENQAIISIQDTGKGMNEETQKRIFEPFFTTKDVGDGTGLGLSISYSIIEKHKGSIIVESKPKAGTTFQIRIPLYLQ